MDFMPERYKTILALLLVIEGCTHGTVNKDVPPIAAASGIGVVTGLNGTGDGGDDDTPLIQVLRASAAFRSIDPANAALVQVIVTDTDPDGVARLHVSTLGPCTDLRGGVLSVTPVYRVPGASQPPDRMVSGSLHVQPANGLTVALVACDPYETYLRTKIQVAEANLLNRDTLEDVNGAYAPYRRKRVTWHADTRSFSIDDDPSPFMRVHDAGHPHANDDGVVLYPNVDATIEELDIAIAKDELARRAENARSSIRPPVSK